jgi:hypothetical protein
MVPPGQISIECRMSLGRMFYVTGRIALSPPRRTVQQDMIILPGDDTIGMVPSQSPIWII